MVTKLILVVILCFPRWLDKLGLAAIINQTRVFRQAFIAREYGLLDTNSIPLPVKSKTILLYKNITWHTHCAYQ